MRGALKLLLVGVLCVYPIAIYFGDGYLTPSQFLAGLLLLLAGRILVVAWIKAEHRRRHIGLAVLLIGAAFAMLLLMPGIELVYLRLYPMLLNLFMFTIFFGSLFTAMPLVERFARFVHSDLPPQAVRYTRQVTWTWSIVLLLAGRILIVAWIKAEHRRRHVGLAVSMIGAAFAVLLLMPGIGLVYLRLYPMLLNMFMFTIFF
ncbi:MAG: hypothetical protein ACRESU_05285, partial [Gammaproteobacteria bacterium]